MIRKLTKIVSTIFICILLFSAGCDNPINPIDTKGKPVELTDRETLPFLVDNSDLIAVVLLSGGIDKPKPSLLFDDIPKTVDAHIFSILKGVEPRKSVEISNSPKFLGQAVKSIMYLRNGKHLVFLSKSGDRYQPTTRYSLLDVSNNRAYPIWRPDQYKEEGPNGIKFSSGFPLNEVISEINKEINKS